MRQRLDMTEFIIMSLAAFRIAMLFVCDDGPFGIFKRIRTIAGIKEIPTEEGVPPIVIIPERFFPGLLSCVKCISIWAAAAIIFMSLPHWYMLDLIIQILAISGLIYLIHDLRDR